MHNPATIEAISTNTLPFIALFSFELSPTVAACVSDMSVRTCLSENESCNQINGVIAARIATSAVIVVGGSVEACVSRVLCRELQVLPGPVRKVRNIARAPRVAIGVATHRDLRIESRVGVPEVLNQPNVPEYLLPMWYSALARTVFR